LLPRDASGGVLDGYHRGGRQRRRQASLKE
jgi:hypothetical protein